MGANRNLVWLALTIVAVLRLYVPAHTVYQRLGKNLDEITQLANKEKNVRVATWWETENETALLKGFTQKYPGIKISADHIERPWNPGADHQRSACRRRGP